MDLHLMNCKDSNEITKFISQGKIKELERKY